MREQELISYWQTIVNIVHDGLMVVDRSGTIVSVNRGLEEMTGFAREELMGNTCTLLNCDTCARVREQEVEGWCMLFRSGSLSKQQCVLTRKDGSPVHVLKNASTLRDERGNVIAGVETMTDVTELTRTSSQLEACEREIPGDRGDFGLVGHSVSLQRVRDLVASAAWSDAPVLIQGESGTGKELIARAVHEMGPRREGPYIKVNCAALNESLIESELFGHVKGAFTGAHKDRAGRFEAAGSGSLFLDEIADLPASVQIKLLRVLEEKVVERVGDQRPIEVNPRIITATNKDLSELVESGAFREDLFYRINVIPVRMPPLRERSEDIPPLAEHFFRVIQRSNQSGIQGMSNEALRMLVDHDWPGNARELRSALEYAFVACNEEIIQPYHFPQHIVRGPSRAGERSGRNDQDAEKKELIEALRASGGNRKEAARLLGVSRVTVWNRMQRYGVTVERAVNG
ncbi:MAG: sigma 54-interacting transcriptional regulator [Desulfohalobiaceae bacterium]